MLTIYPQSCAADVKKYFDTADYYSEGQETIGRWGGRLAPELDLHGTVSKQAFDRLCDNLHPQTGEKLTPRTDGERRVGYDFTFSGPKSFSILLGLASEEERQRLRAAFRESVEETMAEEIEPDMQCRVRKGGMDADRRTGNMVWAAFYHSTARPVDFEKFMARMAANGDIPDWLRAANDNIPPDMQEHAHVFVFNATRDPVENRIKAGQFGGIKRDGEYFAAVFYSKLAGRLEAMCYAIDRRGGKEWEIAGIPQSMIDTFSKRTDDVEEEHANRLDKDHPDYDPDYQPEYKHELAAKTRCGKQKELTPEQLRAAWDSQLTDDEREALARVHAREIAGGPEVTPQQAVAFAIRHCFERESVVPERELKRVALLYGLGDVTLEEINAELPRHGVLTGEKDGRVMATTEDVHRQERLLTAFARGGMGSVNPVGVAEGLERGILDDDQWKAVTGLLSSCDRVQMLDSAAGVGKSTLLRVYDEGMRMAGRHVTYLATTTPAVGVLREDGFAAESVAKFLLSEKMQAAAKGGYVVVDEASMLGLRDAHRLFSIAREKDVKLVFLGDSRQHASVPAGAFMRVMQEYGGVKPYRIATIKRQKNEDHRAAVTLMFEGRTVEGFDLLDKKLEWVKEIAGAKERYEAMAAEYVQAIKEGTKWNEMLLISPTHAEGERVTQAIRRGLREAGLLGKKDHELTRWVSADLTEAERGEGRNYRPGRVDMIQFHQNAAGHKNGTRVEIGEAGAAALPLDQADKFQAYRKETVKFAEGDILRFTANGKTADGHQIRNGSAYRIKGFTASGIRLENGWVVPRDFGHFKHGIETSYGTQSKTVKHAIVGQSSDSFGASNMEQAYVTSSRSKYRMTIYTDDKEALRQAIQRSSLKMAAHDLIKPPATQQATWRRRLAHRRRLTMLERNRADAAGLMARRVASRESPRPEPPSHVHEARNRQQEQYRGR